MARKLTEEESTREMIARNLRNYMYNKNISQIELARKLGVSGPTVSDWCNGKKSPRPEKIDQLCKILGIDAADLMGQYKSTNKTEYSYEISDVITMEDISIAQQINRADERTKRLIQYLLKYNETEQ